MIRKPFYFEAETIAIAQANAFQIMQAEKQKECLSAAFSGDGLSAKNGGADKGRASCSQTLNDNTLTIIDATTDKNQHRLLGQELNSTLVFYDENTPVNNLLAIMPAIKGGCFAFFCFKQDKAPHHKQIDAADNLGGSDLYKKNTGHSALFSSLPVKQDKLFYQRFFNVWLKLFCLNQINNELTQQVWQSVLQDDVALLLSKEEHVAHKTNGAKDNQQQVLDDIVQEIRSQANYIFGIAGERGVGKSFLVGLIAKKLAKNGFSTAITAPNKLAVNSAITAFSGIEYVDAEKIESQHVSYQLLVFDESASLGWFWVSRMASNRAKKGLFTLIVGTQKGYEGGSTYFKLSEGGLEPKKGFASVCRDLFLASEGSLKKLVNSKKTQAHSFGLKDKQGKQRIQHHQLFGDKRYAQSMDALSLFQFFILSPYQFVNSKKKLQASQKKDKSSAGLWELGSAALSDAATSLGNDCYALTSEQAVESGCVLPIYQLLKNTHYKNAPNDFQRFFNQPSLFICAFKFDQIISVCQVFVDELPKDALRHADDVFYNCRRLKGALTQQSLFMSYAGLDKAILTTKVLRVSRIATIKPFLRKGYASLLVEKLALLGVKERCDFISVSFSLVSKSYLFWQKNGFLPVKLGVKKSKHSGVNALLMIRELSQTALSQSLLNSLRQGFYRCLLFAKHNDEADDSSGCVSVFLKSFTWNSLLTSLPKKRIALAQDELIKSIDSVINGHRSASWLMPELIDYLDEQLILLEAEKSKDITQKKQKIAGLKLALITAYNSGELTKKVIKQKNSAVLCEMQRYLQAG